jgi:hypothetical protein
MISRVGTEQYTKAASPVRSTEARPAEARPQTSNTTSSPARPAAVVQFGGEARTLASQSDVQRQVSTTERNQVQQADLEPVAAQPVPDFGGPEAPAAEQQSEGAASTGNSLQVYA